MTDTEQPLKTYRGNCHCGAFVYEIEAPEIKTVSECNCSICYKKGYLWVIPAAGTYKAVKGDEDALTVYSFGGGNITHKFCPTCATPLMGFMASAPSGTQRVVNAHAIQGLNTRELERKPLDGASLGTPYQPPIYTGPEPTAEIENAKTYHGSCHCGAVTLALKTVPLDKEYPEKVLECNCSICERNAYVWIYPRADQVVIQGDENLGKYYFGNKAVFKSFCKTCGVNFTNGAADLNDEQFAALSDGFKGLHQRVKTLCPLNLRVLNGFNLSEVKESEKETKGAQIGQPYVNP